MRARSQLVVLSIAAFLAACGGGGDGTNETGSDAQTRTLMTPDAAIVFAKKVVTNAGFVNLLDLVLAPISASPTANWIHMPKDVGFANCAAISTDPNCKGQLRYTTTFAIGERQEKLQAGTTLTVDFEDIESSDLSLSGVINEKWTFLLEEDLSLGGLYNGLFKLTKNRTTPDERISTTRYRFYGVSIKPNTTENTYTVDGRYIINPFSGFGANVSEDISYTDWAFARRLRSAGAKAVMHSTTYVEGGSPYTNPFTTVTVTVVSSDASRTEYSVHAKADTDDLGTTRSVVATTDSSGELVYSAS